MGGPNARGSCCFFVGFLDSGGAVEGNEGAVGDGRSDSSGCIATGAS